MPPRLRAAAVSTVGGHRASNQDSAFTAWWGAAVADGVGGGPAGDVASAALVHRLVSGMHGPVTPSQLLTRIREANWDLRAHVQRNPALDGMATTLTGVFATPDDTLVLAHTGDSRAYRLREGRMSRQTRDDSFVQVLVDRGLMSAEEAASHPHRNVITASLHGGDDDVVTLAEFDMMIGDRWLLCSDGMTDYVPEQDIETLLATGDPAHASYALVRLALDAGSRDNVTAVVGEVTDAETAAERPQFHGAAADLFNEQLESA
ncbi:PP2C family protein-serine/threonine phosphatase [Microbacterium ulmi]|uniref:Serine/threonine-protein phosphatase n=1 Tax=Microbacterium ulmi TaxID=179095 RepID=A0A7Y2LXW9_9MICO|nr:protein phosphatase 2C domain-containing protein [Microbacterium ulmi]NII70778.1 protein phosphatase [Microbacterium ulmi]NNH02795.1 serine/threonine-protein phosphatase [Microbacterium ulmi]